MARDLTIVIPNRDRNLETVKRSLNSIQPQLTEGANLVVVDYGSKKRYQKELENLIQNYRCIKLILCPTQGQLWNKARSINIALKECSSTYFMICDMDMIWHPNFIRKQLSSFKMDRVVYYPVGFLDKSESYRNKQFFDYQINFKTNQEATGISVFPTQILKEINGFDEFYHGWGSEDTDAHQRIKNYGLEVVFVASTIYFLHQWHPKKYRETNSVNPFHSDLERINASYLQLVSHFKKTSANNEHDWGVLPDHDDYKTLSDEGKLKFIDCNLAEIEAFCESIIYGLNGHWSFIVKNNRKNIFYHAIRRLLNKSNQHYYTLEEANNRILQVLVSKLRNKPYNYKYDRKLRCIYIDIIF